MLKLWLLTRLGSVGWEEDFAHAVVAESATGARLLAADERSDSRWLDAGFASCEEADMSIPSVVLTANTGA